MGMKRAVALLLVLPALCLALPGAVAAADRKVRIINDTGSSILRFYGSNKGTNSWEEDILGNSVLPAGSSAVIDFDDGTGYCVFDFRAIFSDGDELVRNGVNVCEIASFRYH